MRNLGIIFAIATLFASCINGGAPKTKADITTDTLHYTYQEVKERADDCGTDNLGCSQAAINYPLFDGQQALNDTITKKVLRLFDNDPDKDYKTVAKNFIAQYQQYKKAKKRKPKNPFDLNLSAQVTRQDSNLVTILIDGSSLSGNLHPISQTRFINWNTKKGQEIALKDILVNNYAKPLNAIAEKIFRKQENLTDSASLKRDYFFKDGKFYLNNNFLITPVGIRFLYNQYEIKPYAAGTTDLFIPYAQLKPLLKPNTVISQYIK